MNYIIFDLEATCEKNNHNFRNETIEIGAIKLDHNAEFVQTFNIFIKPKLNPKLSEFCKNLTNIQQQWIDLSSSFPIAIKEFQDWIETDYLLCSWGDYDKKQLVHDCILHGLDYTWTEDHFNLKKDFGRIVGKKQMGMKQALNFLHLPLDGQHHRGIDDALNIAQIFIKMFNEWSFRYQ